MQFRTLLVSAVTSFAVSAAAAPAPEPLTTPAARLVLDSPTKVLPRDDAAASSASSICALPTDDPAGIWDKSGAGTSLELILDGLGPVNWLNHWDQVSTDGGSQSTSNLDCADFPTGNCQSPTVQCKFFTPPQLFYVRLASANLYEFMAGLYNGLADFVSIDASLRIDQVFDDFTQPTQAMPNFFGLFIGLAVLGFLFPVGESAAAVGSVLNGAIGSLNVAAALTPKFNIPPSMDPTKNLKGQLADLWDAESQAIKAYIRAVFGGVIQSDESSAFGTSDPARVINGVFSNGQWLIPATIDDQGRGPIDQILEPALKSAGVFMMRTLAVRTLAAQGAFVFSNTALSQAQCDTITGSRWIDNHCYMLGHIGAGLSVPDTVEYFPPNIMLNLDDGSKGYDFDVVKFYQNAIDCQNAGGGNVNPFDQAIDPDANAGNLPQCFVNFPVISADTSPCNDKDHDWSSLGFTESFCIRAQPKQVCPPDARGLSLAARVQCN